ncbi:branched-chain amino acid ABC transporter substrate-binding protein [Thiomonas sp.]|uniref:branched-chain amino acid ABC transporter substrate-binding protein n=1 Tax=Thiomonas sp. TaxID=2047785 RepID=UPI00262B7614|nr:branched-chain amino acid ABC transporter substrate-binding protein [Thiomonas sp.]
MHPLRKSLLSVFLAAGVMAAGSAAQAATPIKIGVQAPITGQYANEGQGIADAVKLLVKQQNAKGGLLGHPLEVKVCDDQGEAAPAAICARQLVNDGVLAVIGSYTSGAALAAQPIYARANVIQTSDGTSDELTARGYKTFFRNAPPNSAEAIFTAGYFKAAGLNKIAVITDHSSFATGLADAVVADAKKEGIDVLDKAYINAGSQNYTPVLTKLAAMNPQAIYFSGYYTDGGLIKAQMAQLGMKAKFIGGDANQNVAFAKIAGNAAAGAIIINVPAPEDLPYPAAKEFLAQFKAAYGHQPPSIFTLTNADGLRAILYTAEKIKSADPAKLIPALHELKDFEGLTGTFSWNAVGERTGSPYVAFEVMPGGAYKIIYPPSATGK